MTDARTLHDAPTATTYEYSSVRAPRRLEPLYRDTYRSFGWSIEAVEATPAASTVSLSLKRDRRIKNRPMVVELQRAAERAMASLTRMERSKTVVATLAAAVVGVIGCAFLAGSILTLGAGLLVLSIVLGAVGLLCWLAGWPVHGRTLARRSERLDPLIDRQYEIVYDATEKSQGLLA